MLVRISCSTKFHAFALAEQLAKNELLDKFYTLFYSKKNKFYKYFHKRKDEENIPLNLVETLNIYLPFFYLWRDLHNRAVVYDWLVSEKIKKNKNYLVFIGWSSMSLISAKKAKKAGKLVIIERGSSHILTQNRLLKEEYKKFGIDFNIDNRIIERELKEYEIADYISIPSEFVYESFVENGIKPNKLFKNPYGVSRHFKSSNKTNSNNVFRILYLGGLTIRKGLIYLFEALDLLEKKIKNFEVWFIGSISNELKPLIKKRKKNNWIFFGHIDHYKLSDFINQCDVAVQPSIEEGLSMVIPQILACGVPVIATRNSGGGEFIKDSFNGYIVPIRNSEILMNKILDLYFNPDILQILKMNCKQIPIEEISWDAYGKRYSEFIKSII